ncbi:MAG: rhodanese-related sulfurtransferase [Pseudoclavibacter sp.]|nr:rhodanese-related sulfurtransferase [Pseudoclavibacter sp.]
MAVPKIILFYVFAPLPDPEAIRLWQRELCEANGLRGRILLSPHGINATLGGELDALKRYVRRTREYRPFSRADVKWSAGTGLDELGRSLDFPRLSVKVREELVAFGAANELRVGPDGVIGGGQRLSPEGLHELLAAREEAVLFDGRNAIEAEIGRFRGAIVPDASTTHDFLRELDSGRYDELKDRPVVTYCTGGVRCEVLSALMRNRGFREVYQLDGGIVRYGERFGNDGLWEGSLAVFDGREHMEFGSPGEAAVLGRCRNCERPAHELRNCDDPACRERFVVCEACTRARLPVRCAAHASDALAPAAGEAPRRS